MAPSQQSRFSQNCLALSAGAGGCWLQGPFAFLWDESSNGTSVYPHIGILERLEPICRSKFIVSEGKQYIPTLYLHFPSALKTHLRINETHSLSLMSSVFFSSRGRLGLSTPPHSGVWEGFSPQPGEDEFMRGLGIALWSGDKER